MVPLDAWLAQGPLGTTLLANRPRTTQLHKRAWNIVPWVGLTLRVLGASVK